jgi:hypothetical protein
MAIILSWRAEQKPSEQKRLHSLKDRTLGTAREKENFPTRSFYVPNSTMDDPTRNPPRESPADAAARLLTDDERDTHVPPEFEPARPRPRFDGWTPNRQVAFIEALAESGCIAEACRAVGMSERSAYSLRARADAISFRNAWDAALDYAMRRLSDAVLSRALHGVAVPVFFQGQQIGEKRYYDERLAMFLLRCRDPLRYGKWLDRRDYAGHPEGSALELAAAKRAVREDADLSADEVADRVSQRLDEIAEKLAAPRDAERREREAEEAEDEGDVS